jgi:hypothetical protein
LSTASEQHQPASSRAIAVSPPPAASVHDRAKPAVINQFDEPTVVGSSNSTRHNPYPTPTTDRLDSLAASDANGDLEPFTRVTNATYLVPDCGLVPVYAHSRLPMLSHTGVAGQVDQHCQPAKVPSGCARDTYTPA